MTATDKKKTVLLGLLVVLAGLSWYFVFSPIMWPSNREFSGESCGARPERNHI